MKESKSPLCHLLSMVILGFVVLFSIAEMASKDGATYVKDIFGNTELVSPKYICIFAASYFLGIIMHALGHLAFGWLSRGCGLMIKCVRKRFYKKIGPCTPQSSRKERRAKTKKLKRINKSLKNLNKTLKKVNKNESCHTKIETIKTAVENLTKKVEELIIKIESNEAVENVAKESNTQIEEPMAKTKPLCEMVKKIDEGVTELKKKIETQKEELDGVLKSIDDLRTEMSGIIKEIDGLKKKDADSAGKTIDSNCKEYYKEYYKVLLNDNCSIPIMEGIVSFLSSMVIVIIVIGGIAMLKCDFSILCIIIFEILVVLAMCLTQCGIYYMVIRESYSSESDGKYSERQDEGDN